MKDTISTPGPSTPGDFLSEHGISLMSEGSADKGVNRQQAYDLLTLLKDNGILPLGIEVWRKDGNRWRIDSAGGWFADDLQFGDIATDALKFVSEISDAEQAIFTIQF